MTHKSPELGGDKALLQRTGREPILKGVNSRVIVDRRGAYLAGNINALLNAMNEGQQLRIKQWSVRIALRKADAVLPIFEYAAPDDQRPRLAIDAARHWLQSATDEAAQDARQAANEAGSASRVLLVNGLTTVPSQAWAARSAYFTAMAASGTVQRNFAGYYAASAVQAAAGAQGIDPDEVPIKERFGVGMLRAAYIILHRGGRL